MATNSKPTVPTASAGDGTNGAAEPLATQPVDAKSFPVLVRLELELARLQFPPLTTSHEAYAVIAEELDEYWEQVKLKQQKRNPQKLLKELVQVAAMCQRAAEDLRLLGGSQ